MTKPLPLGNDGLFSRLQELGFVVVPTLTKRITIPSANPNFPESHAIGMSYPIGDGEMICTPSGHVFLFDQAGDLITDQLVYDKDGMQRIVETIRERWTP
jgi:hypothetical protein